MKKITEEIFDKMVSSQNNRPNIYKNNVEYPYKWTFINTVNKIIDVFLEVKKGCSLHLETYYVDEDLLIGNRKTE